MMSSWYKYLCLFVIAVVYSCSEQPSGLAGGGDDFPNTRTLGIQVSASLSREWNSAGPAPDNSIIPQSVSVKPSLSKISLKTAVMPSLFKTAIDSNLKWDLSKLPFITLTRSINSDSLQIRDTIIMKLQSPSDTLLVKWSGMRLTTRPFVYETYQTSDYDGDSLLFDSQSSKNLVKVKSTKKYLTGSSETIELLLDAGSDRIFSNENALNSDDKIISLLAIKMQGEDTTEISIVKDADSDGFVYDKSKQNDTCLIDLSIVNIKKFFKVTTIHSVFVVFPLQESKNYPIKYIVQERYNSGRLTTAFIKNSSALDTLFYPNDSVTLVMINIPSQNDSLANDTARMKIKLGNNATDSTDDALTGIYLHTQKRYGIERSTQFEFNSATPIKYKTNPQNGTFKFRMDLQGDKWISLTGEIDPNQIRAEYIDSNNKRVKIVWDRNGNVISE